MSEKTVMVTKQAEVLTVTLHRPEALNALNDEMTEELRQVLEAAAADASVRVVVLTGSGRAFCAGGDLNYLESIAGTAQAKAFIEDVGNLVKIIREMPKPVLAKVHGVAAGAGAPAAVVAVDLTGMLSARIGPMLQSAFTNPAVDRSELILGDQERVMLGEHVGALRHLGEIQADAVVQFDGEERSAFDGGR